MPAATPPPFAADISGGRFATVAKAPGISGSGKRLAVALELAAVAREMSADAIIEWVTTYVAATDKPARTIPTLEQRAADAQRMADSLGTSTNNTENGWGAAIDEAHRRNKIN